MSPDVIFWRHNAPIPYDTFPVGRCRPDPCPVGKACHGGESVSHAGNGDGIRGDGSSEYAVLSGRSTGYELCERLSPDGTMFCHNRQQRTCGTNDRGDIYTGLGISAG